MRIKIIKKNIKHLNDKIIDATGDRFVDVSVSSGDRLVIEAQGQTTVITANANQLAQGAIENSQGLQFKRLNFDLLVGNGETTYVRISRFYLISDVQLESVSWNGQLLNDTFVGQLNTWQYGSMVAESPISVSDPGAFVGVSNVSDTVAMGSATTTQVASVGGFSPIGWVASVPATAAGAGISMTGAAVVGGGALLASAAAKGKSSDSSSSTPDTASPTFVSATTSTDGKKIILTYSEDLGATTAKAEAFTVKVGSTVVAINSVAVVGKTIELTMSTAIKKGDAITFAYQAPASDASTTNTAIQDKTGNDAASQKETVVNNALNGVVPAPTLALNKDSGSSNTDGITNDGKVNVTGVESGATWEYSTNSGSTWTTGSGTSFTLAAGNYLANAVQVRQTDAAGNVSATTGKIASAVTVDTAANALTLALATDSGSSGTDGITNVGTVNVTGIESSATWQYSSDGGSTWTTGSGTSFTLAAGTYAANAVQVKQTDVAGNVSATTGKIASAVTVDTTAPAFTSGGTASTPISTATTTVVYDANATDAGNAADVGITYTLGGTDAALFNIASNGGVTFKASPSVAGSKSFTVTATDAAGNTSTQTVALTIAAGPTTTVSSASFSNDTGSSSSDLITSNASQTISGSLSATITDGQGVYVSLDNGSNWVQATTTVNQSTWSLSNQTLTSSNTLKVQVRDSAGNAGATYSQAYTLDTAANALTLALATDSGSSGTDGITNVGTVNVTGIESSATWQYSTNSGSTWTTGSGTSFTLAAGTYAANAVQVKQTDVAGNVSATTGKIASAVTVDTAANALTLALATDSGSSGTDGITNVGTVNVTGIESSATWQYSSDGGSTWTTGSGTSFTLAAGTYAANAVQVKQTDVAGNVSATTGKIASAVTVDTAANALTLALATDSGSSGTDGITNVGTVNVTGIESSATWQYSSDGGSNWSTGSGTSFTLAAGTYAANAVQVKQTDVAGNVSATTGKIASAVTVDTAAPSAPTAALATDSGSSGTDGITNVGTVNVTGIESSATWQYSTNSGVSWTNGSDTSFTLAAGTYAANAVQVRQTDVAGNVSATTGKIASAVTVDTTAPTLTSAATNTDGTQIILTYNENLLTTTTNQAATTAFTVTVRDVVGNVVAQTVNSVASSDNTVTLTLSSAITSGQTVTVAYADPTTGDDANAVQDFTGNDAATLAPTAVTNNSTSSSGPSLASVQKLDNVTNLDVRSALVIAFDSPISLNSGKIKILDDMGNSGWKHTNTASGEFIQDTSDNDIVITLTNGVVTDISIGGIDRTSRFDLAKSVTVNGNNLVIDLTQKIASGPGYSEGITSFDKSTSNLEHTAFDWDFGSNYHVEFDAGIVKNTSNKMNAALSDSTTLNFTTVTPSTDNTKVTASQIMDSTGATSTLSAGKSWVSGNQSQVTALTPLVIDMNQGKTNPDDITNRVGVAVVVDSKGQNTRGTNLAGNVQLDNFGSKDLIYMDNHGDMDMITTDGLQSSQPATWSNTTRTLSNPSGNNSILSVYTDAGITGIGVNGDQYLDTKYGQNVVTFG